MKQFYILLLITAMFATSCMPNKGSEKKRLPKGVVKMPCVVTKVEQGTGKYCLVSTKYIGSDSQEYPNVLLEDACDRYNPGDTLFHVSESTHADLTKKLNELQKELIIRDSLLKTKIDKKDEPKKK